MSIGILEKSALASHFQGVKLGFMAKTQKNVQLPEEVVAWLGWLDEQTGCSARRAVLAGLCALAASKSNVRSAWIQMAVAVEKGRLDFGAVPETIAEYEVTQWRAMMKVLRRDRVGDELYSHAVECLRQAEEALAAIRSGKAARKGEKP